MALQGQCKALLDASHARCMTQLQGLLEAEQWVAVDVPAGFQVRNIVFIGSFKMGLLGLGYVGGGVGLSSSSPGAPLAGCPWAAAPRQGTHST
jgi:hypothetical protein